MASLGLAVPFPSKESLFVEKNVYQWELRRDLAIGSHYIGDINGGRTQCEILRLMRGSPYREEAMQHATYYIGKIPAKLLDAPFTPEPGWHACNPSIIQDGDGYAMVVRTVNYTIEIGHVYKLPANGVVATRNFLLYLHGDLTAAGEPIELETPEGYPGSPIQGFEDVRIYSQDSTSITALANRSDWGPLIDGQRRMPRQRRVKWDYDGKSLSSEPIDITPDDHCEKNWMPFVVRGRELAIYWHDPFQVIDLKSKLPIADPQVTPVLDLSGFRGSGGPIPWNGGWLYCIHEVCNRAIDGMTAYFYMHRLCWMDAKYALRRFSQLFYFDALGVEFCCGMAPHSEGALLTFGVRDNLAKFAVVSNETIETALKQSTIN